jgi:hypothetical protein
MNKRWFKNFLAFVAAPLVLVTACGQQGAVFSILPTGQNFQGSTQSNKIDILWVIDNSGSMLTKQQNLATSFNSFMNLFTSKNYDFRMTIVTTDTYATPGGQNGNFQGTPTVISNSTPSFSTVFQTNVVVGSTGAADAKGLDAINLALSSAKLAGVNTGFIRSDAHLAVIILSDADDNDSTATAASTHAFLKTLKPNTIDANTGRERESFSVHAAIDDQTNPGPTPCAGSEDGVKFRQLANLANGTRMDICASNFSSGLTNLSESIASFISQVLLKSTPQVDTIEVAINGAAIAKNSTNGWSYQSTGNKIIFHGTAIPADNASISVTYIPTDIIR